MSTAASLYPHTTGMVAYQPSKRPVASQILITLVPVFLAHVLAVIAILYYPPTWPLIIAALVYHCSFQSLGITIVYHRCLAHHAFDFRHRWVERVCTTIGTLGLQNGPIWWCSLHRIHHQNSDSEGDPHNSRLGFWYAHVFWLVHLDDRWRLPPKPERYAHWARDIASDPYYMWLDRHCLVPLVLFFGLLFIVGGVAGLLWVGIVTSVVHLHVTWLVNSASHLFGYQTFRTSHSDDSKNNWLIALLAKGEGWHNNHHAIPSSAKHGFFRWWEFDFSYLIILLMEQLGLVTNVKRPTSEQKTIRSQ